MSANILKVMTYNIRSGRGRDGCTDLERISRVITSFDPDVVALQEVNALRRRSGAIDQTAELASRLSMEARFAPTLEDAGEQYGIATLSRLPIVEHHQVCLPQSGRGRRSEPRCALITHLRMRDAADLVLINTHLSVMRGERQQQVAALLDAATSDDVIVAGDLNCTPWSPLYRKLRKRSLTPARGARSWPAPLPLFELDHILYRGTLSVVRSGVWAAGDARHASDHLPVVAEFRLGGGPS